MKELNDNKIHICTSQERKKKGKGHVFNGDYVLVLSGVDKDKRIISKAKNTKIT